MIVGATHAAQAAPHSNGAVLVAECPFVGTMLVTHEQGTDMDTPQSFRVHLYPVCRVALTLNAASDADPQALVDEAMTRVDVEACARRGEVHFADWMQSALVDRLDDDGDLDDDQKSASFEMLNGDWVPDSLSVDDRHTRLMTFVEMVSRLSPDGEGDESALPRLIQESRALLGDLQGVSRG